MNGKQRLAAWGFAILWLIAAILAADDSFVSFIEVTIGFSIFSVLTIYSLSD